MNLDAVTKSLREGQGQGANILIMMGVSVSHVRLRIGTKTWSELATLSKRMERNVDRCLIERGEEASFLYIGALVEHYIYLHTQNLCRIMVPYCPCGEEKYP